MTVPAEGIPMRAHKPHPTMSARSARRRVLAAALTVSAATGLHGTPAGAATRVFVVGDSLTVGARDFGGLRSKFANAGYEATVEARTGRGVEWGLSVLRNQGRSLPSTVVVALGTNDVASGRSTPSFGELVDRVMAAVGPNRIVVWVNLDLDDTSWGAAQEARFNRVLRERAGQHDNLAVADWDSYLDGNRSWLAGDRIHLNGRGYRQRAWFYLWQVQAST